MRLLRKTINDFIDDDCMSMAAALAYNTIFSLPALLLIVVSLAGLAFGQQAVQRAIQDQIGGMMGENAGRLVGTVLQRSQSGLGHLTIFGLVGLATLLFGATSAFAQLQTALNRAWKVKPDPHAGGLKNFVFKRLLTFGMILVLGFLLLVSLALTTALSAAGGELFEWFGGAAGFLLQAANFLVSFLVITALFAAMFKILPDAKIEWRDVWAGAIGTTILFNLGKLALGLYLAHSSVANTYGAASSIIVVLLWTYYASMIVLLGAEFAENWTSSHKHVAPEEGAVKAVREEKHMRPGQAA